MNRRVVVTGLGLVTPLGCDVEQVWEHLLAGKSGIHELTVLDTSRHKVKFGGDVPNFDPGDSVDAKEAKRLDRFSLFAMYAAKKALDDSGIDMSSVDPFRCGTIVGSGIGGLNEIEAQMMRLFLKGPDRVSPFTIPTMMLNAAGGNIAIRHNLRGPNFATATACASSSNAMGDAIKSIRYGEADLVVTGGSEAAITDMGLSGFANMKALSTRHDSPAEASRPFDADRDGFVLSEGAGILVFEEYEHARQRGARIYCEVKGYGGSCDAGHITQPDAEGTGASRAMQNALSNSALAPDEIDYINAHGTSTPLGDKAESKAIRNVFGSAADLLNVSSTKGHIGHTLGASGGIEMIFAVLSVANDVIPPTINYDTPDPDCDLNYTPNQPQERVVRNALNNSFGFGGHNACLICGKLDA